MQIAIVGMACRLPGADDLDAYWTLIRDGVSTAQPLPDSRFDRSLYYDPKRGVQNRSYSDIACLVNEHAQGQYFDQLPQAVRDCPEVAYRTLCDVAAEALADAQLELSPAHRRSGGVYLGHARSSGLAGDLAYGTCIAQTARLLDRVDQFRQLDLEHDHLIRELVSEVRREYPHRDPNGRPRLGPHAATTLLAETFAIDGPHMTFNSACASSLSALYQASLALQHGRIDVALVGGASVCHFETLLLFSQAQSLSGVMSRPFDHDADGLVVGEGYAVVILKTLEKAIQDGDRVHAVIRGIGTSSDGKGRSLWAPRKQGQVAAIRRAYPTGLPASSVQYIEAHATSTQLGDATEVAALTEAFDVPDGSTIPIGSVKANIGHTLETAGLAGLLKVVLSMRNETIGPAANLNRLNQKVDWESLPFYVPRHAEPWESPADSQPRRAAVNAFGIGGLNVHVVVEEHKPVHPIVAPTPRVRASSHGVETRPDPVAVVGRGTVLPGALNVDAFAEMLTSGMDPKGVTDDHRLCSDDYLDRSGPMHWHTTNHLSGQVKGFQYDWQTHKIPPKQIAHASPLQFMILDAVEQAFAEAGIDPRSADRSRIGVVVGSSFGGEFSTQLLMGLRLPEFQKRLIAALSRRGIPTEQCAAVSEQYAVELVKHLPALLDETGSFTSSSLASRITKAFDLMGGGVAVDAGNCGSAAALACCVDQLQSHDCDMMICVGGQEDLSPTFFERLSLAGLLSSGSPKSPFDTAADGTVPGEGCAAVLLMRHVDARRRQKQAFALIRGIGASTADSQPEACEQAVRDAFASLDCDDEPVAPSDIARIETTSIATGQAASDELEGLLHGYAEPDRHTPITLDCLMTQTGHLGAASGLAALIKSSLELHTLATPAVYGLSHPAAVIESNPLFSVSTEPSALKPTNEDGRLLTAVNNADRQIAYHILLERESKVRAPNDHAKSSSSTSSYDQHTVDGVPLIDATRRRRDAMRDRATQATAQLQGQSAHDASSVDETHEISTAKTDSAPSLVSKTTSMTKAVIEPVARELSATQLEAFLIGFIVEQTGYPAEFVEMGADLEADLGIDSIKKAQMFGELGEQFSITPDENLTLDDFPTLQHVLDYLAPFVGPTKPQTSRIAGEAEKVGAAPPRLASPLPEPLVAAKKAGKERAVTDSSRKQNGQVERQIEQEFLEFFSEQTGYPVDFVEMDAKLDGDLAIDAPRKKQLLEELSRAFAIPKPERTNDQSLATVGDLLEWVRSEAAALPARSSSPSPREDNEDPKTVSQSNDRQNALIPEFKRLTRTMDLLAMAGLSSPYFAEHETVTRDTTQIDGKEVITFCSSNYLGMSGDPRVNAAAQDAIERLGTSVSASRLIAGKPLHRQLEDELARFLGAEATIVFSSGYAANESTIGHLFGPGDLIIHDSLAHNCIIQGAILSGAHRLNFPHNDFDALDQQLERVRGKYRRTLIAIEGVYSMDGDHCDLPTAIEIKHRHDAFLLVDDAHAIGTMGATGRGSPEFFNVDPAEIDLWVGTLSKALGSGGGFVAGSRDLISYLKHSAPGFIYTVALSPACAGAALASLELVRQEPQRITKLQNNAALLLDLAKQRGLDVGPAARTPIVPVMVGNSHTALLLSRRLLDRGIDIQPIVHPAVENDAARLRFMVTAKHTEDQIRTTIDALADDLKAVQSESVPIDEWKAVLSGKKSLPDTTANGQPANSADEESAAKKSADIADQPSGSMKTVPSVAPNNTPSPAKSPTSSPADLSRVELRVVSGELIDPSQECHWTKKDLREYLINFIVEQTGYPPEFVEMDADLEADLGIDSIKKAQLFGELGQHFEITPDETLTLDDFPSLQEVFDYIGEQTGIDS